MLTAVMSLALCAAPVRVAVLPFEVESDDPAMQVLRRGLADLLVTDLIGNEPVVVVERARLDDALAELKLQQSKYFDPTMTVKLGKMVSATHLIACSVVSLRPTVRIVARVYDLERRVDVVKASVKGTPDDVFALEEALVKQLLEALRARFSGTTTGHASLDTVLTFSQGLALADQGDLEAAKSKYAEAVRLAPDFTRAKEQYVEVLRALRAAQKKRGATLDEGSQSLRPKLVALLGQKSREQALAARQGLANLALLDLSRLVGGKKDTARWVAPEQRAEAERLEAMFVEHAAALVNELRAVRGQHVDPALPDALKQESERLFGLDVSVWDFASPTSVALDLGNFLGSGWSPYRSDVPQFAVRPSPAQRSPAQLEAAKRWFDVAQQELARDDPGLASRLANERAELLVLLGRREEAVAQWQAFLDAHPTAEEFPVFSKKLEAVLLLDDDAEREERQVKSCEAAVLERGATLATRTWRAKGRAGLLALTDALLKCGKKDPRFERDAWDLVAAELRRVADCEGYEVHRAKAAKAGVTLGACMD